MIRALFLYLKIAIIVLMDNKRPHFEYEDKCSTEGNRWIAGIDEVGRGPWAGPVVAAAVVLPAEFKTYNLKFEKLEDLNDSKKLSEKKRVELDVIIREIAVGFGIGEASCREIDEIGLQPATFLAFSRSIEKLDKVDYLLIDGMSWKECKLPNQSIIQGDAISMSIAAASIIAKVYRDNLMCKYHQAFPNYGFDKHKGYGTKIHTEALAKFGICELHRKSFKPIRAFTK